MEILYIGFQQYGPFRKQGFQFCGDLRFSFNSESKILTVKHNTEYVHNFFQSQNSMTSDMKKAVVTNINYTVISQQLMYKNFKGLFDNEDELRNRILDDYICLKDRLKSKPLAKLQKDVYEQLDRYSRKSKKI
jgi:hypothetical protein